MVLKTVANGSAIGSTSGLAIGSTSGLANGAPFGAAGRRLAVDRQVQP